MVSLLHGISPVALKASLLSYLFRDNFVTADPAPLTAPRSAEPGPGSWEVLEEVSDEAAGGVRLLVSATRPDGSEERVAVGFVEESGVWRVGGLYEASD